MRMADGNRRSGKSVARRGWVFCLLAFALCLVPVHFAAALEADELLLIVNKNVPQGRKLAQFYAQKRNVPDHRILELDLPMNEEMPAAAYDRDVVPVVRSFLRENGLERKVTCLVTFYGVPVRVMARVNGPKDADEKQKIQAELQEMVGKITPIVEPLEKLAAEADVSFRPQLGTDVDTLGRRAEAALRRVAER